VLITGPDRKDGQQSGPGKVATGKAAREADSEMYQQNTAAENTPKNPVGNEERGLLCVCGSVNRPENDIVNKKMFSRRRSATVTKATVVN
jgi:hypothetical protein